MGSIKTITYKGQQIVYTDFRDCTEEEMIQLLDQGQELLLQGNQPTLQLINITRAYATSKFVARAKEVGNATKHLTRKEAIVGVTGAKKVMFYMYSQIMGGVSRAFETEEEGKEWLIRD